MITKLSEFQSAVNSWKLNRAFFSTVVRIGLEMGVSSRVLADEVGVREDILIGWAKGLAKPGFNIQDECVEALVETLN